jgi:DNA/RNA endonuclease G (NUC1)
MRLRILTGIFLLSASLSAQDYRMSGDTIITDIFKVIYSEELEQPLDLWYRVECPVGEASRKGMDFRTVEGIHTSDNDDYKDNEWDKGHLAPAAAFNCDRETLLKTFSYLNCALQHEGLNRGPWKELERFERDLAKVFGDIHVEVRVHFDPSPRILDHGAALPCGFTKIIIVNGIAMEFYFPNEDIGGKDWSEFLIRQ